MAAQPDDGAAVDATDELDAEPVPVALVPQRRSARRSGPHRGSFQSFVADASRRDQGAGAGPHRVELEDEQVVEAVQRGVRSRLYRRRRFSPAREAGVHHFHRLLAAALA
jgi:hypothetical protein